MQIVEVSLRITAARSWQSCQPLGPTNVHAPSALAPDQREPGTADLLQRGTGPREGETSNRQ